MNLSDGGLPQFYCDPTHMERRNLLMLLNYIWFKNKAKFLEGNIFLHPFSLDIPGKCFISTCRLVR